jgi:uncharacterized protein
MKSNDCGNYAATMTVLTAGQLFLAFVSPLAWSEPLPACDKHPFHNCVGTLTSSTGTKYVGEFKEGKQHGHGTTTWSDGEKYAGKYKDGKKHGQGTWTSSTGAKYVGEFNEGKILGQGTYTWPDGGKYVGELKESRRHGHGTHTCSDGNTYTGEFDDHAHTGQGTYTCSNGYTYVGVWKDGKLRFSEPTFDKESLPYEIDDAGGVAGPLAAMLEQIKSALLTTPFREWEKRAGTGDPYAQAVLGGLYAVGLGGVTLDVDKAVSWTTSAANNESAEGQAFLGALYGAGWGVKKNNRKMFEWMLKAAEQGHTEAQANVGKLYASGLGVRQNEVMALAWYLKAARQGEPTAAYELGLAYQKGGTKEDHVRAKDSFLAAAKKGHEMAQLHLGYIYYNGIGVEQSYTKAAEWFSKAAQHSGQHRTYGFREKGNAEAQRNLGLMYIQKQLEITQYEPLSCIASPNPCAPHGSADLSDLGALTVTLRESAKWFLLAADQGDMQAQFLLANVYDTGIEDYENSAFWYLAAANQGHSTSQWRIATQYLLGQGVPKDLVKAYKWTSLAVGEGEQNVQAQLKSVSATMSRKDISKAKKLAKQCLKTNYEKCN